MTYSVYTTKFDQVINAKDEVQNRLEDRPNVAEAMIAYIEEYAVLETPLNVKGTQNITLLLDCSGSMRGRNILLTMAALLLVGDALEKEGRTFQILGFTTKDWKGGEPRKQWMENGRPRTPGRLNALRHIVFKSYTDDWEESRPNFRYGIIEGLLKENIDGEAILWAKTRMDPKDHLVFISDGAPVDDSTLSVNPTDLLEKHLNAVVEDILLENRKMSSVLLGLSSRNRNQLPNPVYLGTLDTANSIAHAIEEALQK